MRAAAVLLLLLPMAFAQLPGLGMGFGRMGGMGRMRGFGGPSSPFTPRLASGYRYAPAGMSNMVPGAYWTNGYSGTDLKTDNEDLKKAYDTAKDAYDTYQKAILEAQQARQTRALERAAANAPLDAIRKAAEVSRFKATAACKYTFQCPSEELCISGGCLQIGAAHRQVSCGTEFSTGCEESESCWNFSCIPDPSKST